MSTARRKINSYDDGDHCKKAIYVFVYLAGHCVPGCVPDPAALVEKVHDRNGRMHHGYRLYAGGLRNLSSAAALPEHLGGKQLVIERTTRAYHGYMAVILFVGYLGLVLYNMYQTDRAKRIRIPWLLAIGILVQFGWEAGLLIGGIRSAGFSDIGQKLHVFLVNSLLETNLGLPYIYCIYIAYSKKYTEDLRRRSHPVSFTERIEENNK